MNAPIRKDQIDAVAAGTLVAFNALLGLNQALVKLVNGAFSPVFQSGLRSACAFFVVLAWAIAARKRLSVRDGSLPYGLFAGFLFALEFALLFYAVEFTSVARASLLFYSMPFMTALGAHFLFPEDRLTHRAPSDSAWRSVASLWCWATPAPSPASTPGSAICWPSSLPWRGPASRSSRAAHASSRARRSR